ncbi:MAG: hypothetical protein [Cressdnaviricota sp.]|nr:MAG: hypothetical protein [Cressdnaviricota sp.]
MDDCNPSSPFKLLHRLSSSPPRLPSQYVCDNFSVGQLNTHTQRTIIRRVKDYFNRKKFNFREISASALSTPIISLKFNFVD